MNKVHKKILGTILMIAGTICFIVSSFNLKHDAAWLSVMLVSVVSVSYGIRQIDNL